MASANRNDAAETPQVEETPASQETTVTLTETVQENTLVEYIYGPTPVSEEINGQDVVVGMASIQRIASTDYKTKQPTGEKLVFLVFQPNQGRASRLRWKHATASVDALRALIASQ